MKIHSKWRFAQGLAYLCLGVLYAAQGISARRGLGITMGILWGILALTAICLSMDEKQAAQSREAERRNAQAARRRFGKWAWPVRQLGVGLAILGLFLMIRTRHLLAASLLIIACLVYTLLIESRLKSWAERDEKAALKAGDGTEKQGGAGV